MKYQIVGLGINDFAIFKGDNVNPVRVFAGNDGLERASAACDKLNGIAPVTASRFGLID